MQPAINPAAHTTTQLTMRALPLDLPALDRTLPVTTFSMPRSADATAANGGSQGLPRWKMHRLEAYIDANLGRSLGIDQLAQHAGLSTSYFCRAFKRSFGVSPHAYIMRKRFEHARGLMLSSNQSLSDIALACGLFDQAHLCNLFRRMAGQSPSRWRRQHASIAAGAASH